MQEPKRDPNIFEFCKLIEDEECAIEYAVNMELLFNNNTLAQAVTIIGTGSNTCALGKPGCNGEPYMTTFTRTGGKTKSIVRCRKCWRFRNTKNFSSNGLDEGVIGQELKSFFSTPRSEGLNRNKDLSIQLSLLLIYTWSKELTLKQMKSLFGDLITKNRTFVNWRNFMRELILTCLNNTEPMGGPGEVVQIDESLLRRTQKDNRGRQNGNSSQNYGNLVEGPWILGIVWKRPDNKLDMRMFYVEQRDEETLGPIIKQHIAPGTIIRTDDWEAYKNIALWPNFNFIHETVNDNVSFVHPLSGAKAVNFESIWAIIKAKLHQNMSGTKGKKFQPNPYLAEEWWRRLHTDTPYLDLVEEIRKQYPLA